MWPFLLLIINNFFFFFFHKLTLVYIQFKRVSLQNVWPELCILFEETYNIFCNDRHFSISLQENILLSSFLVQGNLVFSNTIMESFFTLCVQNMKFQAENELTHFKQLLVILVMEKKEKLLCLS